MKKHVRYIRLAYTAWRKSRTFERRLRLAIDREVNRVNVFWGITIPGARIWEVRQVIRNLRRLDRLRDLLSGGTCRSNRRSNGSPAAGANAVRRGKANLQVVLPCRVQARLYRRAPAPVNELPRRQQLTD